MSLVKEGLGLFIDPSLYTGLAVVDLQAKDVKCLDCMDFGDLGVKDINSVKNLYDAFTIKIQNLINEYDISYIGMEYINAVFGKNSMNVYRMNVLFQLSILKVFRKGGDCNFKDNIYLLPNPSIRSILLKEIRTKSELKSGSLTKAKIKEEVCEFFKLDKKLVKSNYNKSDALAVAYALLMMFRDDDFKKCTII